MPKVDTWLPIFPGFYETGFFDEFQYSNEVRWYKDEVFEHNPEFNRDIVDGLADELDCDGLVKWDHRSFQTDSAKQACQWVEDMLNEIFETKEFKVCFQRVIPQRAYNFKNDAVDCAITYPNDALLLDYLKHHLTAFEEYIKENYTSCDGFISRYSNDVTEDGWLVPDEWHAHQFGAVLDFIVRSYFSEQDTGDIPENEMLLYVNDHINYGEYLDFEEYEKLLEYTCVKTESMKLNEEHKRVQRYINSLRPSYTQERLRHEAKDGYSKCVRDAVNHIVQSIKSPKEVGLVV